MKERTSNKTDKKIIGLVEEIQILSEKDAKTSLQARIDTGASKSSMDKNLAKALKLGPIIKKNLVKQSNGSELRPVINVEIILNNTKLKGNFTLSDRSKMSYRVLIGQNLLKKSRFLIDPNK